MDSVIGTMINLKVYESQEERARARARPSDSRERPDRGDPRARARGSLEILEDPRASRKSVASEGGHPPSPRIPGTIVLGTWRGVRADFPSSGRRIPWIRWTPVPRGGDAGDGTPPVPRPVTRLRGILP